MPIFESMPTARGGSGKTPHNYFHETLLRDYVALVEHQFSIHVG
jgi:hypothetical protein